jgi:hypothetical protein
MRTRQCCRSTTTNKQKIDKKANKSRRGITKIENRNGSEQSRFSAHRALLAGPPHAVRPRLADERGDVCHGDGSRLTKEARPVGGYSSLGIIVIEKRTPDCPAPSRRGEGGPLAAARLADAILVERADRRASSRGRERRR